MPESTKSTANPGKNAFIAGNLSKKSLSKPAPPSSALTARSDQNILLEGLAQEIRK